MIPCFYKWDWRDNTIRFPKYSKQITGVSREDEPSLPVYSPALFSLFDYCSTDPGGKFAIFRFSPSRHNCGARYFDQYLDRNACPIC